MADKRVIATALAVWLASAAFLGFAANALPNHVIAGGVYGAGGDISPAPTNPANAAMAVYYSPMKTLYTPLTEPNILDADGTDPAIFSTDVGASWDWVDLDDVLVVVETVRGTNGWANVNYTTSVDGVMHLGSASEDIGDGTLEAYPTLTATAGPDYVDLSWTGLADVNGNIVSYGLYRAPAGGSYALITTRPNATTMSFSDTGLAADQYCYVLGVDYRRDNVGGIYTTTGRSEPVCRTVAGNPPYITSTTPANAATGVLVGTPIVIDFSEPMNIGTVVTVTNPSVTLTPTWSLGDTRVTYTHPNFAQNTPYTVTVAGQDLDGNSLVPNPINPAIVNPWMFVTESAFPAIWFTYPQNDQTMVPRTAPVFVVFTKEMNPASLTVTSTPSVTFTQDWQPFGGFPNMLVFLNHTTDYQSGTNYNITIAAQDTSGNSLGAGPVPNPWDFTTNNPPTVTLTAPSTSQCCSGGSDLTVTWTMSDAGETPTANLLVWLNYTRGSTGGTIYPIAGPLTGNTSHVWTLPSVDDTVEILIEVVDEVGDVGSDIGPTLTLDAVAPTVSSVSPANGATNVATDAVVTITFSEPMDPTATQAAVSLDPAVTGLSFTWSGGNTTLAVAHTALFQVSTTYYVNVSTSARDDCNPGLPLASAFSASFATGAGPKRPNPPTGLTVASKTTSAVSLTWTAPTTYTDGSPLPASEIQEYRVYRALTETGTRTPAGTSTTASFTNTNLQSGTQYYYWVTVVDTAGRESVESNVASAKTLVPEAGFNILLIVIPLIVILLIIGVILLLRRKKPAAVPEEKEAAPPEEAVEGKEPEAKGPEEIQQKPEGEGGKDSIPCPKCGTTLKPTDVECFVCGTKL